MKLRNWVLPLVWAPLAVVGQTGGAKPEFEVASIRPSGPQPPAQLGVGLHIDGAQVTFNYLTLKDYIAMAHDMKNYQVSGPDWIATTRFDIAAKVPPGTPRDQVRPMLKTLLEERFHMKTHPDTKDFDVYALVVGKGGPKMKESPLDPEADGEPGAAPRPGGVNVTAQGGRNGVSINYGRGAGINFANNRLDGRKLSMPQFAEWLWRFSDRPVVDRTDLKGTYDFSLEFTPEDFQAMMIRSAIAAGVVLPPQAMMALQGASGDSLIAAVEKLGLKLESRKAPIEVLVVDQVDRTPTEN